jgi:DNA-binding response OmpR family regulator
MEEKKILVIDDDVNLLQSIKFTFMRAGAEVVTAMDGREGLHRFYEERPDLVILDVRMPDIDGWETCRQIRIFSNVPIIMLTTMNKDEDIIRGLDYGADDFVTKPFSRDVLLARARALLRRRRWADHLQRRSPPDQPGKTAGAGARRTGAVDGNRISPTLLSVTKRRPGAHLSHHFR